MRHLAGTVGIAIAASLWAGHARAQSTVYIPDVVELSGPGKSRRKMKAARGLANGVTVAPTGTLFVSSAQGDDNQLVAYGPPTT